MHPKELLLRSMNDAELSAYINETQETLAWINRQIEADNRSGRAILSFQTREGMLGKKIRKEKEISIAKAERKTRLARGLWNPTGARNAEKALTQSLLP